MSGKDTAPPRYTPFRDAGHPHLHAIPEDPLTTFATRSPASLCEDASCKDLVCRRQQAINRHERARFLFEHCDREIPNGFICYDCGIFHPRLQHGKQDLLTYPVDCKASKKPKSRKDFYRDRTTAILFCSVPVPWLQAHQTARSLRHGPQYGVVTLDYHRVNRMLGIRCAWQTASKALLVDDRLLVRTQHFMPIGNVIEETPRRLIDQYAELICPHTRSTFLYANQRANDIIEACRLFCHAHAASSSSTSNEADTSKLQGFVHSRYRCPRCPTESVLEILPRARFAGAHMMGRL
ncbi:hypothetical protein OPT61_g9893 [Boeremia exigua]|uniref:Uncharacterized protein n=1 Tax=Boeremia exigua TaxID=749465 RepID=A0ACC2HS50_9PLEO|nr:hypothetical protein OPT61_g9893 [Boeremia exigua]